MIPPTMRAVLLMGHGGLEQLEYRDDVPVPRPRPGEVLIRVGACGMNNTDVNTRVGWYAGGSWGGDLAFPRIQGADPAGRIAAVGPGVEPARVGERVLVDAWISRSPPRYLGSEVDGGFAEYVMVPAGNAHPVDTELSDVELASFPCSYATAEHMLHRAGVTAGQRVLVSGASGGVGGALIQLAKRRGAEVVAVTSAAKADAVREVGADAVVPRGAADLAAAVGAVDVFADVVGGASFPVLFETIRPGGHYVTAGAVAGAEVRLDLRTLYLRDLTMHGATVLPREVFAALVGYVERGEIRPVVAGTFPLQRLAEAQEAFLARRHVGSYVVDVAGEA